MLLSYGLEGDAIPLVMYLSISHSTKYFEMSLPPSKSGGLQVTPSSVRETTKRVTFVGPNGGITFGLILGEAAALFAFHGHVADDAQGKMMIRFKSKSV